METRNKTWSRILLDIYKSDAALKRKGPTIELPPIVNNFIRGELIQQMKVEDDLFRALYVENVGTGSYYQGLRVYEATEFDIDVELDLCDPVITHKDPGWVQLNCKSDVRRMPETTRFLALMDSKGTILPDKVVQWFKKVCQQALDSLIQSGAGIVEDLKMVDARKCGPAVTISVTANSGERFDVDLVPVYCHARHEYHCVPKKGPKSNLWRITHFAAEKQLLEEPGCAKKVIKLLKLFRDRQGPKWNKMASYYLKTIVMYMISGERRISWRENLIGLRFIGALKILNQYLIMHYIPFYPDAKENLLRKVGKTTVEKMQKDLEMILKETHDDPRSLREVFVLKNDEHQRNEKVMTEGRFEEKCAKAVSPDEWTPKAKASASITTEGSSSKPARKSSVTGENDAAKGTKARKASKACSTESLVDGIRCDAETAKASNQSKVTTLKAANLPTTVSGRKKETTVLPKEKGATETNTTATTTTKPATPTTTTTKRTSTPRSRKIPDTAAIKTKTVTRKTPLEEVGAAAAAAAVETKTFSTSKNETSNLAASRARKPRSALATRGLPVAAKTTKLSSARRRKIPYVAATKTIRHITTKTAKQVSTVDGATSGKTGARKPLSIRQSTVTNYEASKAMTAMTAAATKTTAKASSEAVGTMKTKPKPVSSRKSKTPDFAATNTTAIKETTTRIPSTETEATAEAPAPWRTKIYDVAVAARTATATTAATRTTLPKKH